MKRGLLWSALALVVIAWGLGGRAPALGAEALTEKSLFNAFTQASHKTHSLDETEMAVRLMRERFPESKELPGMEFRLGSRLAEAYMAISFLPEGEGVYPAQAMEHLARFLPDGPYAHDRNAQDARLLYAECLLAQGKKDESHAQFLDLMQCGKPAIETAALRKLVQCREALGIDDKEVQGLEARMRQRLTEQPKERAPAKKFLDSLDTAREDAADLEHVWQKLGLAMESGHELEKVKQTDLFLSCMKSAAELGAQFIAMEGPIPLTPAERERSVKARQQTARANYTQKNYAAAIQAAEPILPFVNDPDPKVFRPAVLARLYWNQSREAIGNLQYPVIDADLLDLLGSGRLKEDEMAWIFLKLATHAQMIRQPELQYLYLRDAVERLRDPANTFIHLRMMRHMEDERPEYKSTPPDVRSPADERLAAAGLVVTGRAEILKAQGKNKPAAKGAETKQIRQAAKKEAAAAKAANGEGAAVGGGAAKAGAKRSLNVSYKPWQPEKKPKQDSAAEDEDL